jgi:chromosome partitioning protein
MSESGLPVYDAPPARVAPSPAATVIAIANQKGGVGKTTTTVSLGAAVAERGLRVLVADLDPQANASTGLDVRVTEGQASMVDVIVDGAAVREAIRATAVPGLDVLPASLELASAEVELVSAMARERALVNGLAPVRDGYDLVLVDCPPSLGLLTVNAFVASDQLLVPVQCEYYALEGLTGLLRTIALVEKNLNPGLAIGGVALTMYDGRTRLAQQVVEDVRAFFGPRAFETIIPRNVRLSEAPSFAQPITVFDPESRGSDAYRALADELVARLGLTSRARPRTAADGGSTTSGGAA